jgi:hypothetical protein
LDLLIVTDLVPIVTSPSSGRDGAGRDVAAGRGRDDRNGDGLADRGALHGGVALHGGDGADQFARDDVEAGIDARQDAVMVLAIAKLLS